MTARRWLTQHTSLRGRLMLLLFVCIVLPLAVTASVAIRHVSDEELARRAAADVQAGASRAWQAERGLHDLARGLDDGSQALALQAIGRTRTSALPRRETAALVAVLPDERARLPPGLLEALQPHVARGMALAGYLELARLPGRLPDERFAPGAVLAQVVVEPLGDGRAAVAWRELGREALDALPACESGRRFFALGRRTVAADDPPAAEPRGRAGGDAPLLLPEELWLEALGATGDRESVRVSTSGGVWSALPLLDLAGRPVGLVGLEAAAGPELSPTEASDTSVLVAQMRTVTGWIAIVGVVVAILLGVLAPQWVWSDIRDSTDRIFRSVERLRELVDRNSGALREQVTTIDRLNEAFGELEGASKQIHETTRELARTAEGSARVSQSGNRSAEQAQRAVLDVRDQVAGISALMDQLGQRCREIGDILQYVDQLNANTKRVSVNATIKAGDSASAGRQLAWVAGEIRELADQAVECTQDIERRVREIQTSSETTLGASQQGRQEVEKCLASFEELEAAFERILRWVEETTQFAHAIDSSTATQTDSLVDVSQSVSALQRRASETQANFRDLEEAIDELANLGEEMMVHWRIR